MTTTETCDECGFPLLPAGYVPDNEDGQWALDSFREDHPCGYDLTQSEQQVWLNGYLKGLTRAALTMLEDGGAARLGVE